MGGNKREQKKIKGRYSKVEYDIMKFKGMKKYDVILVYDGNSVEYEEEEYIWFAVILINDWGNTM